MINRKTKRNMARIKRGFNLRKSPPVLITISPDSGSDHSRPSARKVGSNYSYVMGSHATITCFFGDLGMAKDACVALFYPRPSKKYIRKGIRNYENEVHDIINHESIHHALMWLADDPLSQVYDQIDYIVKDMRDHRRILEVNDAAGAKS